MTKITFSQSMAGALVSLCLAAVPAAALERTFVSGKGTDIGACSRAAPCRTFAFAITRTNVGAEIAGGEIDVLDPADYGPVSITKAINIINDGVGTAGILVGSGGTGVSINAGPSDFVHLRGLTIAGLSGSNGIILNSGGRFLIENCVIWGFNGWGIIILPTGSGVVSGVLSKVVTTFNGGGGISVDGKSATGGSLSVTVDDSVASNNGSLGGIAAISVGGGAVTNVSVRNSDASNNGTGLLAQGPAILRVGHSVVTGNATGANKSGGGAVLSYGDNDFNGNTNNNTGVLTPIAMH